MGSFRSSRVGFILPHEHTQCALWHIQDRWDYWELTPDEPVTLAELAAYRDAGGTALADLTLVLADKVRACEQSRQACTKCLDALKAQGVIQ